MQVTLEEEHTWQMRLEAGLEMCKEAVRNFKDFIFRPA